MTTLEQKLHFDTIIEKIEKARLHVSNHHIVKIVAASKYVGAQEIEALYNIGQRAFGENKVQDMKTKVEALQEYPIEWHFIGNLQKNKINQLLSLDPYLVHSVDSIDLAVSLNERLEREGKKLRVLVQVNSAFEESKSGFHPDEFLERYAQIIAQCPHLQLMGIMSIGAHSNETKIVQKSFEITHSLYQNLSNATVCSMGMSGDFELAIQCGSNLIRLGSILFKHG